MKKTFAVILLSAAALWPLACGKNLSPTGGSPQVVVLASSTPTPTSTATATPSGPTATPTPAGWNILGPVTLSTGEYDYGYVHLHPGGVLTVNGAVTLNLQGYFALDAGATVEGNGTGYPPGTGPGAPVFYTGGGGAHGGAGGSDQYGNAGGSANDDSAGPTLMGSGGGAGSFGCSGSGAGGGLFFLDAPNGSVTFNGTISMDGADGENCPLSGGGGAGGAVFVQASSVYGSGLLQADGGQGGPATPQGGGGGGGIIVLSDHLGDFFSGSVSVDGGGGYQAGGAGSFSETNF